MSIRGHRGSSGSGWKWTREPVDPQRPLPPPPLLPFAGLGVVFLLVVLALVSVWLSDDEGSLSAGATPTPAAPGPIIVTPLETPRATPTPEPTPSSAGPTLSLGAWDGAAWRFNAPISGRPFQEGKAVPFLLRIAGATPGEPFSLTLRYDCAAFDVLTAFSRDSGNGPALAPLGPGSPMPDSSLMVPDDADDAEAGFLSLWGGAFTRVRGPEPGGACDGERSLTLEVSPASDALFLSWGGLLSDTAAEADSPLSMSVSTGDGEGVRLDIALESVAPSPP